MDHPVARPGHLEPKGAAWRVVGIRVGGSRDVSQRCADRRSRVRVNTPVFCAALEIVVKNGLCPAGNAEETRSGTQQEWQNWPRFHKPTNDRRSLFARRPVMSATPA